MKTAVAATLLAASLVVPATAHADCGGDGQSACTGPVPSVDQVMDIMNELADPNIPTGNKNDIVRPPFNDDQAQKEDTVMNLLRLRGIFPVYFTVTDIQPALNNTAGATVSNGAVLGRTRRHAPHRAGLAEWALDDHPSDRSQPNRRIGLG
jgi:hypothetical protein